MDRCPGIRHYGLLVLFTAVLVFGPVELAGQQRASPPPASRVSPEVRIDALFARVDAVHAGIGISRPVGNYVRTGIVAGAGFSSGGRSARIDLLARFYLDPFRASRWAAYGGGGLTTRFDQGENAHTYLMLLAGVDGPVRGKSAFSVEAALGGGARIGIVLRRATAERR